MILYNFLAWVFFAGLALSLYSVSGSNKWCAYDSAAVISLVISFISMIAFISTVYWVFI